MVFIGNIPLFLIGWRFLGGLRFGIRTATAVIAYSFFVDFLVLFLPEHGITDDIFLNSLYGAVVAGFGYGTGLSRTRHQRRLGHPGAHPQPLARRIHVCQLFDGGFIGYPGAGLVFGWKQALYALITLYVSGLVAETTLEGPTTVRTALIVTGQPETVSGRIMEDMSRGVTIMPVRVRRVQQV